MPVPKNGRLVHFINNLKMYETNQGSLNFDGSGIWVRPLELIRVVPRGKWVPPVLVNDQSEIVQLGPAKNGRIRLLNTANDSNNEKCGSVSDEYK